MQGKRPDQYEKSAEATGWAIAGIFTLLLIIISLHECESAEKPGWLVCVTSNHQTTIGKFTNPSDVSRVVSIYFPELGKEVARQKFIEVRTQTVTLYVERKRAKITRTGKIKFKKEK